MSIQSRNPTFPSFFFFNDKATTEIYTLSLHDALPIYPGRRQSSSPRPVNTRGSVAHAPCSRHGAAGVHRARSEEHTSELQSRQYLVCRLLLVKKKTCVELSKDIVHVMCQDYCTRASYT